MTSTHLIIWKRTTGILICRCFGTTETRSGFLMWYFQRLHLLHLNFLHLKVILNLAIMTVIMRMGVMRTRRSSVKNLQLLNFLIWPILDSAMMPSTHLKRTTRILICRWFGTTETRSGFLMWYLQRLNLLYLNFLCLKALSNPGMTMGIILLMCRWLGGRKTWAGLRCNLHRHL